MIISQFQQIMCHFATQKLFAGIKGEVAEGQRIGLVGRNGEGKTTLLNVMAGDLQPTEGTVTWKKGCAVGLLKQSPEELPERDVEQILRSVFSELTAIQLQLADMEKRMESLAPEELERLLKRYGLVQDDFIQRGGYDIEMRIDQVLNGLKIKSLKHEQWGHLSGGERTKIGLAKLLLQEPDLLLLDEPTNHLDLTAIEWLGSFISHYKGTVVLVSHDRYFLDETVTHIWELDQGELIQYTGNYSAYIKEREARLLIEFQQYQDQQKKIQKMKDTVKRLKEWANRANPPNAGMHRQAKSIEKAIARIELLDRPVLSKKQMALDFQMADRSGKDVVRMEGVWKEFGDRILFQEVSMHIRFGERAAIIGMNMDIFHEDPNHQHRIMEQLTETHRSRITIRGEFVTDIVITPIKDDEKEIAGYIVMLMDVTTQAEELKHNEQLIKELSSPILHVWHKTIALPLIGEFDKYRSDELIATVLMECDHKKIEYVLLDLSGITDFQDQVRYQIQMLTDSLKLIGTDCILVGISPKLAMSIRALENTTRTFSTAYEGLKHIIGLQQK